jgi:hypothetical protein
LIDHPDVVVVTARRGDYTCMLINMYNQNYSLGANEAVRMVRESQVDWVKPVFMCGNFNLHHLLWHLEGDMQALKADGKAEALVVFANNLSLELLNDTLTCTWKDAKNQHNLIINLGWSLEEGLVSTFSVLEPRAGLHSDHLPIQATLHLHRVAEKKGDLRLHVSKGSKKKWQATFERVFTTTCLEFIDNAEELKQTAEAFFVAAQEADCKHREAQSGHISANNPWWNAKCSKTKRAWADATHQNKEQCANRYRTACAEAKGAFFTDMLENLRDPKDLFKKVCATKGRQAKGVRALRVRDKHAAELEAQVELLGKTFFPATRT